jgi:hypothetical protein
MNLLATIDIFKLYDLCDQLMDGHIHYGFGAKAAFTTRPEDIRSIDCSGFVRYFLYRVTDGAIQMPDGSVVQNDWCRRQHLDLVDYDDAGRMDELVRIAFLPPRHGHAGHVWLIHMGRTLESHGGKGPDRRAWDTQVLADNVQQCYVLATAPCIGDFVRARETYA